MKRVLWVSRHQMTPEQREDLERVMKDQVELVQYKDTVENIEDLKPFLKNVQAAAVVLPPEMTAELVSLAGDCPILQSVSWRIPTGRMRLLADGRLEEEFLFEHRYWQQILELKLNVKRLG